MHINFKKLLNLLATILSIAYSPRFVKGWSRLINKVFSKNISRKFNKVGNNLFIKSSASILGFTRISIGDNFQSFSRLRLEAIEDFGGIKYSPLIRIGNNVSINNDCHIAAINLIQIGNNVLIGSKVLIIDHSHGVGNLKELNVAPLDRQLFSKGPVVIGNNVWIGEGVAILPGVSIGDNSIIGANSVVCKDVPKNVIFAGNPAKKIREMN